MKKEIYIVGCGISAIFLARILAENNYHVTIFEKNAHIGGNCYDLFDQNGILIHKYGPHIFHTNNEDVYQLFCRFTKFNDYTNKVLVDVEGKLVPLPINFQTIRLLFPKEKANKIIETLQQNFPHRSTVTWHEIRQIKTKEIDEFFNYLFPKIYSNYSSKMWGIPIDKIDPSTINRVQIVLGEQHNYFPNDKYQGLPVNGYTKAFQAVLDHPNIDVRLNTDAFDHLTITKNKLFWDERELNDMQLVYCGMIDQLGQFQYGQLPYRSLHIEFETFDKESYQQAPVINYPAHPTMTRIAEYKKMTFQTSQKTTISREYPGQYCPSDAKFNHPYYPISNEQNFQIYEKYYRLFFPIKNLHFLGRLAQYKYFNMDQAIQQSIALAKKMID